MAKYSIEGFCDYFCLSSGDCFRKERAEEELERAKDGATGLVWTAMLLDFPEIQNLLRRSKENPSEAVYTGGELVGGVIREFREYYHCGGKLRSSQTVARTIAEQQLCDGYKEGPTRKIKFRLPPGPEVPVTPHP